MDQIAPIKVPTRSSALAESILDLIKRLGPGVRLPKVRDLAASFQVSTCTLDRVLADLERKSLIVRKHSRGIFVSDRVAPRNIGLVFGRNIFQPGTSPVFAMAIDHATDLAQACGSRIRFYLDLPTGAQGTLNQLDLAEDIRTGQIHGILLFGGSRQKQIQTLAQSGIPLVVCSHLYPAQWMVQFDYAEMIRQGVQILKADGCRRLAFITPLGARRAYQSEYSADLDAFRDALKRDGLSFEPGLVWENRRLPPEDPAQPSESAEEMGSRAIGELLERNGRGSRGSGFDGLLVADDIMARGAVVALGKRGMKAGTDLRIASHSNRGSTALFGCEEEITRVELDPAHLVKAMLEMLNTLMDGKVPPERTVLVKPSNVLRAPSRLDAADRGNDRVS